jgi:SPP1 family predicted phage head-tail adaptor
MPANVRVDVGSLKHRVSIQAQTSGSDGYGQQIMVWSNIRSTWAKIATVSSRELYLVSQFTSEVTHLISIRGGQVPIAPGMRVLFGARVFDIQAIEDVAEQHILVNLMCVELDAAVI